jgi:hypothetical protein
MAVSVIKRPRTNITNGAPVSCTVLPETTPAAGVVDVTNAIVVRASHGLVTGDYVYLKTNIDRYNGFWYVTQNGPNGFNISRDLTEDATAAFIKWIQDGEGTYTAASALTKWNCIHLPIIYKLSNTLWPTNSADTTRTMTVTNSNGYCAIVASGDIKTTGSAAKLEFVKVTNAGDYNGVYQIISYTNDTTFTIDLVYSSDADTALTAGNIQYYYNNYVTKVEVWGGLNVEHEFYSVEPYELLGTLDLIPDENNEVKFSISDILKKNIAIKNNLLLGTLPNNLDAFTKFFIKYGEEYDDSDGTTLSRSTVSYTSDYSTFQGYAVNAKLPFKNVYSGALSQYVTANSSQKFLTNFSRPTLFSGQYFDLSYVITDRYTLMDYKLRRERYLSGVLQGTSYDDITMFNDGVYRTQIEVEGTEDRIDASIVVRNTAVTRSETRVTSGPQSNTYDLFIPAGATPSATYNYSLTLGGSSAGDSVQTVITYNYDDGTTGIVVSASRNTDGNTTVASTVLPTPSKNVVSVTLQVSVNDVPPTGGAFVGQAVVQVVITDTPMPVTETKIIDVDSTCLLANASGTNIVWQNNLGGFDQWYFKGYADDIVDIVESTEAELNTFPDFPNSVGEFADTINYETSRRSRTQKVIRSQGLTLDQLNALKYIKSSILVQIVNSIYDRRTVIVDKNSFKVYTEGQQTTTPYTIEFTITYTDDIPSQTI